MAGRAARQGPRPYTRTASHLPPARPAAGRRQGGRGPSGGRGVGGGRGGGRPRRGWRQTLGTGRVKPGDIAALTRQLAALTRAGVPLVQAFDILADGADKPAVTELVAMIKNAVASGDALAAALAGQPRHFDELIVNLVAAGEQSGALPTMLERVATHKEKAERLKAKLRRAMTYPIAVLCVALVVSGILLVEVVPQFERIFAGFGAELPGATLMVIGLSEFVQAWWPTLLGGGAGAVFGARWGCRRLPTWRRALHRLALRLPIIGGVAAKSAVARCTRTLATAVAAGVPVVEALRSVAGAAGNVVFERAVLRVRDEVATGREINAALKDVGLFPNMVVQMVAVGEAAGSLADMLDRAARWYEEEVDDAVDNLAALAEPAIMAVLGVAIGGLVAAMYLPIFQLGGAVGA